MTVLFRWIFFVCLFLLASPGYGKENVILIIKSSNNDFFNTTIESLINKTNHQVKFIVKNLTDLKKEKSLIKQATYIITLGITAADYAHNNAAGTPAIHSYITEFQYLNNINTLQHSENQTSIFLNQPLQRYLHFIKLLLGANKVGIMRSKNNIASHEKVIEFSKNPGVELEQVLFEKGENPLHKIKDLLKRNDVLLSSPNPNIYNRHTLKGILLSAYRQNKPVISYSPSHVKSGALAAIFSSPENIGHQISDVLNHSLEDINFRPENFYYAAEFDIQINQRVAKSLNLKLADEEQVLINLRSESKQ